MPRRLELGEAGTPRVDPQVQDSATGRWVVKPKGDNRKAGRYRGRVSYRGQDGVAREITRYAETEKKAKAAVELALAEREHHTADERLKPSTPFLAVGKVWLERIARSDSGLSGRTVSDYTATFGRYVDTAGSALRGLTLAQAADRQRLRAYLQRLAEAHGDGAVHMTRSVLSAIFRMAERDGVLPTNPMLNLGRIKAQQPKETQRDKRRALTRKERDHLLDVAYRWAAGESLSERQPGDEENAPAKPLNPRTARRRRSAADLCALLAGTGARITEGRLTRWEHVDLGNGVIRIDGTKSQAAVRTVNAPPWLLERLQARADEFGQDGYVIPAPSMLAQPERAWEQSNASSALRELLDAAGLEWATPHSLRRTVASMAHAGGVPLARIAGQLGQTDLQTTLRSYIGREFDSDKSDIAAVL